MLTYSFENTGKISLYEYLYECIKNDILSGKLEANDRLPSKRAFASNLGVSVITVENAYGQLMSEGYIYSKPKSGFFVSDVSGLYRMVRRDREAGNASEFSDLKENAGANESHDMNLNSETEAQGDVKKDAEMNIAPLLADFSSNSTSPENFPFAKWTKLTRETIAGNPEELMKKSPSCGVKPLREAIARHLRDFRNMEVDADDIVVGAGTEYLYGLLVQLLGRDQAYAVETPGYSTVAKVYEANGAKAVGVPLDDDGLSVDKLEETGATVAHVSPTHQYPTGITMPIGRRYELLAWAQKSEDRYIIEDDYDSEFRLSGKPMPTLRGIDHEGKVIYLNTFSKSLSRTIRVSYIVLPKKLMARLNRMLGFYSCTVSNFEQYTLAKFIDGGLFEKHINHMRLYYSRKHDAVIKAIRESSLADRAKIIERDTGLHFLVKFKTEKEDHELAAELYKKGIRLQPLKNYGDYEGKHVFILCYSSLDTNNLGEALEIVAETL